MNNSLLSRKAPTSVFQLYFCLLEFLKALPPYVVILSWISNKEELFMFSAIKVAAEEVP